MALATGHLLGHESLASVDYDVLLSGPQTATWQPPTPTTVTATSTAPGYSTAAVANNAGMSGTSHPQDVHDISSANMWLSVSGTQTPTLQIDLGGVYALGKMQIWNFNAFSGATSQSGRGVRFCYIGYSTDGTNFTWLDGGHGYGGLFELAQAPSTNQPTAATNRSDGPNAPVDFLGAPGRYVAIWMQSNWGGAPGDSVNQHFGLGAVRVYRYASNVTATGHFIAAKALAASSALSPAETITSNLGMSDAGSGAYSATATVGTTTQWWTQADDPSPYILFDLGGTYPLAQMAVWNYNVLYFVPSWGRGIKNATIYYALGNRGYNPNDPLGAFLGWTKLVGPNADQTWTFNPATSQAGQAATNSFSFGNVLARYVMIVPNVGAGNGNWGGVFGDSGVHYGLSQIRFFAGPGVVAEPAPFWNGLFGQRAQTGSPAIWGGADGSFSIAYPGPGGVTRSLFTFSDTFADTWSSTTYQRPSPSFQLHNSYAVYSGGATLTPAPSAISFDISHEVEPSQTTYPGSFFWVDGGVHLALTSGSKIYILAHRVAGATLAVQASTLFELPLSSGIPQWASLTQNNTPFYYKDAITGREYNFANSILDRTAQDTWVYIYGLRTDPHPFLSSISSLIVGRVKKGNMKRFSYWRFWNGSTWVADFTKATPITGTFAGSSGTVAPAYDAAHAGQFMFTTSSYTIGSLSVAYASSPWGPFGDPTELYAPPESDPGRYSGNVWSYCGKQHPELSVPGEALMSYCINALNDTYQLNADVYHPRFVRVRSIQ